MPQRVPPCQPCAGERMTRTKSPGERLPVGVLSWCPIVSSVRSCWRREAVALHALEASLHDVDLHRLTSSSSGSPYRAALVLGWAYGDTILTAIIGGVCPLACLCAWHKCIPPLRQYDITLPRCTSICTICTNSTRTSTFFFVKYSDIARMNVDGYTIAIKSESP